MRRASGIASWTFVGALLLFLFLPVVTVVLFAFNSANSTSSFDRFSLTWFDSLRHNSDFWEAFANTAKAAVLTVVIDELIGIPAALALVRRGVRIGQSLRAHDRPEQQRRLLGGEQLHVHPRRPQPRPMQRRFHLQCPLRGVLLARVRRDGELPDPVRRRHLDDRIGLVVVPLTTTTMTAS